MVENKYGKSGHFSVFTALKRLLMVMKCNYFRASFNYTLSKTV